MPCIYGHLAVATDLTVPIFQRLALRALLLKSEEMIYEIKLKDAKTDTGLLFIGDKDGEAYRHCRKAGYVRMGAVLAYYVFVAVVL